MPTGLPSRAISRSLDVVSAFAGLVVLSPVLFGIAMSILYRDGWPVFFTQTRVGRRGRLFRIWKFRTMRGGSTGPEITAAGDVRVSRLGALLRRFKLDELPQLFNVLRGDMSLVGPRPETPEYVQFDAPVWQAVLQVRPGVTGPASLLYRNEEKLLGASADPESLYRASILPAKLLLNLRYLLARSIWRDVRLIYLTIRYSCLPRQFSAECIKRTAGI